MLCVLKVVKILRCPQKKPLTIQRTFSGLCNRNRKVALIFRRLDAQQIPISTGRIQRQQRQQHRPCQLVFLMIQSDLK